jgi:membrane-associated phospholipid phosphatase
MVSMEKEVNLLLKRSLSFYLPYFVLVFFGGLFLIFFYKNGDCVQWFCENYNSKVFHFFSWFTLMGEPQILVPIAVLIFLLNYGKGVFIFSTWLIASLITIVLKGLIDNHRPAYYFEEQILSCAGDIQLWYHLSTPSGHTTAAFAFFASLAIVTKYKSLQFIFFLIAVLAGVSRMVLFMHFYYDVYWGAIIGGFSAVLVLIILKTFPIFKFHEWHHKKIFFKKK